MPYCIKFEKNKKKLGCDKILRLQPGPKGRRVCERPPKSDKNWSYPKIVMLYTVRSRILCWNRKSIWYLAKINPSWIVAKYREVREHLKCDKFWVISPIDMLYIVTMFLLTCIEKGKTNLSQVYLFWYWSMCRMVHEQAY